MTAEAAVDDNVRAAQERLARSRLALMRRMGAGQKAGAPPVEDRDGEPVAAGGWLPFARTALRSWWHRHPASALATLAEPPLQRYARERPLQLLGYAAAAGAAAVVLRPWRLVPLTALLATVLRTSDLAGLAATLITQKKNT